MNSEETRHQRGLPRLPPRWAAITWAIVTLVQAALALALAR